MQEGRIINLNGGIYKVELNDGSIICVKARGKLRNEKKNIINEKSLSSKANPTIIKNSPKVGDIVQIENNMIDHYLPRKNEMIRPDIANVDQILLVFAAKEPDFSFYLLDLFLVNILKQNIEPLIVISKIDKLNSIELNELKEKMNYYELLGYRVLYVNSLTGLGLDRVKKELSGKVTILSGQTGAGKSTLINAIYPDFSLETNEISYALGRGKHTTRETNLYKFDNGGYIGDTPGFSKLDLLGVDKKELSSLFIEFKNHFCKFKDCMHTKNTKGCGVALAVENKEILNTRYENYLRMLELKEK